MLQKSRISNSILQSDEWRQDRLGKFTSSRIYEIMGERGLGEAGLNYIRTRAFEAISGVSSEQEVHTMAMAEGLINEPVALRKFQQKMGIEFMVTQKLIYDVNPRFASTPDGIWIKQDCGDEYDVATIEVKCFGAAHHMEMVECPDPETLKKTDKKVYWQCIDQMLVINCLRGYAVFYHPALPIDNKGLHIIEFNKVQNIKGIYPIRQDMGDLYDRKTKALKLFEEKIK